MTKTAEELYSERLEEFTREFIVQFVDGRVGYLDVVEFLEDEEAFNTDLANDLLDNVNAALDTMVQRYIEQDN